MIEENNRRIKVRYISPRVLKKSVDTEDIEDLNNPDILVDHPKLLLYQLIRRCHDYITAETDKNLAALNSSQAQYQVLRILDDLNCVSMTKISKLLFRGKSNLTTLIDRMERAGLVERIPLEEDRRVNNIVITAKGKKLHDKVAKQHRRFILEKFQGLSDQEVEELLKLLTKTAQIINPEGAIFNVDAYAGID